MKAEPTAYVCSTNPDKAKHGGNRETTHTDANHKPPPHPNMKEQQYHIASEREGMLKHKGKSAEHNRYKLNLVPQTESHN